ncbi:hypothetical protein VM1G_05392 [Cytospora mali]|uniref:Ecp2 effector protein-like domain-containing protein n=1 Tax=Cytospora mali TaxID=578113 RepID=A0A194W196_CYTMA|nr:hypothetical protein VM1G_05392 [Valsa mali]
MQAILFFLSILAANTVSPTASLIHNVMSDAQDDTTSVRHPTITYRDSTCTAQDFYGADEPSDMCGPSTFVSLTDDHCNIGDASLVDDCNDLLTDLQALNGGGFWGMVQNGTLVIASHSTCTFQIETKGDTHEFAIGTQDMIDIIISSISMSGVPEECKGQKVMAVTGVMACTYKGTTVDTTWWIEGPSKDCD